MGVNWLEQHMAKDVTAKDVAAAAAVSVVTVSRVLNNHANVAEGVRRRVLEAAAELGYLGRRRGAGPNGQSKDMRRAPLKDVGFLFDSHVDDDIAASNPFWSHILAGVETEARNWGIKMSYRTIVGLIRTPHVLLATIREMRLDGILLVGTAKPEVVRLIQSSGLPLVLVDNHVPQYAVDSVLSDNVEGAKAAVNYLIDEGHISIAFIGGPTAAGPGPINIVYTVEQRAMGYWAALRENGLSIDDRLFEASDMTTAGGYESCKRLLARRAQFSALLCANDETAIGATKALREAGRRVPDDVSVVGFDDIDMAEHLTPALTTVRIHKRAIGATAVKTLIARAADPDAMPVTILLPTELIKRDSVAARRARTTPAS
jgi:DNA-binding LacI/PurR family transcriptional regulator